MMTPRRLFSDKNIQLKLSNLQAYGSAISAGDFQRCPAFALSPQTDNLGQEK